MLQRLLLGRLAKQRGMEESGKAFGSDVLLATAEVNKAKNSLSRKAGFSPTQWVRGRDIRLPADMIDDGEVERLGAQAAAATPTTRFA